MLDPLTAAYLAGAAASVAEQCSTQDERILCEPETEYTLHQTRVA